MVVAINEDELHNNAVTLLAEMKEIESHTKLYKKRINDYTVVYCKDPDRVVKYEYSLKQLKKFLM